MKLNSTTKNMVDVGDSLIIGSSEWIVVNVVRYGRYGSSNAMAYTITDINDGRTIYAYPSSKCYGAEIRKMRRK